jgi:hypothetical protein
MRRRSSRDRVFDAVKLLRLAGRIRSVDDYIATLHELHEFEMVEFVDELKRVMGTRPLDLDTAIAAGQAHDVTASRGERDGLIESCDGRKVALLFPLPPHVHEHFIGGANVTLMVAPGHKLPPHLRKASCISNPREISRRLDQFDVIVFEGFEEDDGTFFVEAGIAAVLDLRNIAVATRLLVHLRPHRHDDDESFDLSGRTITKL